ncbi:hypothetical protein VJ923_07180 [Adlercreutzia sp. R25]|uniref:hypothetical protein n=1 Tax=Adlercreutzia shanghongiae TaxID=3111773 RepID=UPI002DBDEC58|nr:hypothetical protein [Adlercreutzia sp. R25]MEC4272936.1 hypothetical protein [Adlercreutzia sp. R25]
MSASEMLRKASREMRVEAEDSADCVDCLRRTFGVEMSDYCYVDDMARSLEAVADKVDAEQSAIIEARRKSAHHIMRIWAEKRGMPLKERESITEWLDRWFIQRPRFEDGEPVQWSDGSDIEWDHGDAWYFNAIDKGGAPLAIGHEAIIARAAMVGDGRVKRPAPEVLGADGKPLKAGETVWGIYGGGPITIDRIAPSPEQDELVVWSADGKWTSPYLLTHEKPDSLEQLRDDMQRSWENSGNIALGKYIDRIDALIARKGGE